MDMGLNVICVVVAAAAGYQQLNQYDMQQRVCRQTCLNN